ncbi:hypothetical protein CJ030_MR7G027968 [Morella rubra]|uniref:RNase H type-1 domain-containing protein n=1 Tax=Morella rubra TaxID=262757 RepID=A0A6A1V1V9_9ROSI|nr:hypothetical protein CJ030_MR7G027968 [Morella rubra]
MDIVWFSWNQAVHEGKEVVVPDLQTSLTRRVSDHSVAWLKQDTRPALFGVPPEPDFLEINFDVAICQSGSYIVVSCQNSSSSLCTVYMEQVKAMDPLLGEAMAAARAMEIALSRQWSKNLLKAQAAWSIHWVSRKLNQEAHPLAQWAARDHVTGFFDSGCIPHSILFCDSVFPAF